MNKIIFFRSNTLYALIVVCICMFVCNACHKSSEPVSPDIPVVKPTYAIHGIVMDMKYVPIENVTVKIKNISGKEVKTNSDGIFEIPSHETKGNYTLEFSKAGFMTVSKEIKLTASLSVFYIRLPQEPVSVNVLPGEDTHILLPGEQVTIGSDIKLSVLSGALNRETTIGMTETIDPITENAVSLSVLHFSPDQTVFNISSPLVIYNPLDEYELENIQLEWYDPSKNKWIVQSEPVVRNGYDYQTNVNHFSTYRITGFAEMNTMEISKDMLDTKYDNLNGRVPVNVEKVPYTYERGIRYIIEPESALASAGITDQRLARFIRTVIYATDSHTNVETEYPVNVSIPSGVRMDVKGVQKFTTASYTFYFKKDGKVKAVLVKTESAGSVSITTSLYTKEHTGGGVN